MLGSHQPGQGKWHTNGEPQKSPVERVCARKTPESRQGASLGHGVSCAAARGSSSHRKKKRPGLQGPERMAAVLRAAGGCKAFTLLAGAQDPPGCPDGMVWGRERCVGTMGACCRGPAAPPLAAVSPRFTQMFLGRAVCGEASVWLCRDFWLGFFPSAIRCPFDVLPLTPQLARGARAGSESPGGMSRGSQLPSAPPEPPEQGWVEPPNTHRAPWHRLGATLAGGRPPSPPHRPPLIKN